MAANHILTGAVHTETHNNIIIMRNIMIFGCQVSIESNLSCSLIQINRPVRRRKKQCRNKSRVYGIEIKPRHVCPSGVTARWIRLFLSPSQSRWRYNRSEFDYAINDCFNEAVGIYFFLFVIDCQLFLFVFVHSL